MIGLIGAIAAVTATAQPSASGVATVYPMDPAHWETLGEAGFEACDDTQCLRLGHHKGTPVGGGQATLKGVNFRTGVIEFDLLITGAKDFVGPVFRHAKDGFGESIYLRPHLNGKPDAIQYTPIVNGNLAWQIFTGPGFEAEVSFPVGRWMRVRTDVYAGSAALSIDGKKVLHIPHLKGRPGSGQVGLLALAGGDYVRNFTLTPLQDYADPTPIPMTAPLAEGTVSRWTVSRALTEAAANDRAARSDWSGAEWVELDVETNGIANLSKAGPDDDIKHSFLARFQIESDRERTIPMDFGFSDSVRIVVNGRPMYEGADLQSSRDYRFLGHVGFWDAIYLPLRKGANDIVFVVTDKTNGGTAAAARLRSRTGISVR